MAPVRLRLKGQRKRRPRFRSGLAAAVPMASTPDGDIKIFGRLCPKWELVDCRRPLEDSFRWDPCVEIGRWIEGGLLALFWLRWRAAAG